MKISAYIDEHPNKYVSRAPLAQRQTYSSDDEEFARVRRLLFDLRPDHPDPLRPLEESVGGTIVPRGPRRAAWDFDAPPGFASMQMERAALADSSQVAAQRVQERIRHLAEAGPVCRWLRDSATLRVDVPAADALRLLYDDAGRAFPSVGKRKGRCGRLHVHAERGRQLVREAERAWNGEAEAA